MPRKETWHSHEERSASCNITIKAFPTPRALTKRPYEKPHNHHSNTNIDTVEPPSCVGAVCNSPSSCTYSFVILRAVAGSIRVPTTVNQNVTMQPKCRDVFSSARHAHSACKSTHSEIITPYKT